MREGPFAAGSPAEGKLSQEKHTRGWLTRERLPASAAPPLRWGEGVADVGSVLIERTRFEMSGMKLVTVLDGIRGLSATKQARLLVTIKRPLWDPLARVPYNDVHVHAPALRLAVDDSEYLLLWGVLGSNLSEPPTRLPPLFPPPPVRGPGRTGGGFTPPFLLLLCASRFFCLLLWGKHRLLEFL